MSAARCDEATHGSEDLARIDVVLCRAPAPPPFVRTAPVKRLESGPGWLAHDSVRVLAGSRPPIQVGATDAIRCGAIAGRRKGRRKGVIHPHLVRVRIGRLHVAGIGSMDEPSTIVPRRTHDGALPPPEQDERPDMC